MVLVLFQLIFLNKTNSTSCRDLSPNRPCQELNLHTHTNISFHLRELPMTISKGKLSKTQARMSKVTSINPGGALDLDARDPNNLNEHLQVKTLLSSSLSLLSLWLQLSLLSLSLWLYLSSLCLPGDVGRCLRGAGGSEERGLCLAVQSQVLPRDQVRVWLPQKILLSKQPLFLHLVDGYVALKGSLSPYFCLGCDIVVARCMGFGCLCTNLFIWSHLYRCPKLLK